MTLNIQSIATAGFQPKAIAASVARVGFWPVSDARSGYWRLFFMQMQEDALKPPKTEPAAPSLPPTEAPPPTVRTAPAPRKKLRKSTPVVALAAGDAPPAVPDGLPPLPTTPIFSAFAILSIEIHRELQVMYPHLYEMVRSIKLAEEAANDADIRRRLLLLAA